MRLPAQQVTSPLSGSTRSTPARWERSNSVPLVAHNGAKECPAPATRTVSPRRAASTTAERSSASELGVTRILGLALTFPAQFVHIPLAIAPSGTMLPRLHFESMQRHATTAPTGMLRILVGRVVEKTARRGYRLRRPPFHEPPPSFYHSITQSAHDRIPYQSMGDAHARRLIARQWPRPHDGRGQSSGLRRRDSHGTGRLRRR